MKISKKNKNTVKSSTTVEHVKGDLKASTSVPCPTVKEKAMTLIKEAIEVLTECPDDQVCLDSIANLSVVYADLSIPVAFDLPDIQEAVCLTCSDDTDDEKDTVECSDGTKENSPEE